MRPKRNVNFSCSCSGATIPVLSLAILGAVIALIINNAQLGICAIPSERFVNPEACVAAIKEARLLYALAGGVFGAFAGFVISMAANLLLGRSSIHTEPETTDNASG